MTNRIYTLLTGWLLAMATVLLFPVPGNAAPQTFGTIQGHVWNDLNNNGLQDAGEPGLGSVWVQVETPTGGWVAGGFTDMSGDYSYGNIPAGSYKVKVANPGNGFNASTPNVGSNDAIDSDVDIYGYSDVFTLAVGQTVDIDGGLTTGGQCYTAVTATSSNVTCSGSTFSFQITATGGTSFGGVSWGWNGAGLSMQPYGQPISVGPFPCGSPATVVVTDVDNPFCTSTVTVNSPACCGAVSTLTMNCTGNMNATTESGQTTAIVNYPTPTASTTCSGGATTVTRTSGPASGSAFPIGTTQVCYKATDNCGNIKTCCFNVTVTAGTTGGGTLCDQETNGCTTVSLAPITTDASGNVTLTFTVKVDCQNALSFLGIELPAGCVALAPANGSTYTAPSGRTYTVQNPVTNPFYGVKFTPTGGGIALGASDVFSITLPAGCTPLSITRVDVKAGVTEYVSTIATTNCPSTLSMNCPVDMNVNTLPGSTAGVAVSYNTPNASSTCSLGGAAVTRTSGPASGSTFPVGTTQVCFKATDNCGNTKTCCFNITVTAVPAVLNLICPIDMSVNTAPGATSANATFANATASSNCYSNGTTVSLLSGPVSGSAFPVGTTQVCFKATDNCGSAKTCCFNVTVTAVPAVLNLTCPVDMSVQAPVGSTSATVNYTTPTATSNCYANGVTVTRTSGPASGSSFPIGTTQVCYKATDACGNVKTCCFNVTVTPPPSSINIVCPLDMNMTAPSGATGMVVTYATPTATTTCAAGGLTVTRTSGLASGSTFPIGTTQVCFKATDACGNVGTCCFNVTVVAGSSNIQITCPLNMNVTAPAGATGMVVNYATPTATTTCAAGGLTVTRTSGLASGSTFPIGTTQVCFKATDACGNVGTCCFNVTVNPTTGGPCDTKTDQCVTVILNSITTGADGSKTLCFNVQVNCMNGLSFLAIELPAGCVASSPANGSTYTAPSGRTYTVQNPTSNPFYSIKFSPVGGGISQGGMDDFCITLPAGCTPLSTTRVSVKAGNKEYVVNMNTTGCPPSSNVQINCPLNMNLTAPAGATGMVVTYATPTATTTCAAGGLTVTRTSGLASGSTFPVGTTQVCFKATDACGNVGTCCFNVTVTAPASSVQITCPLNMNLTAPAGATGMVVTYATPTATTTCASGGLTVTRTSGLASGSTFPVGTTQVCFKATDNCGNVGTCCFNVTVTAPASSIQITCPLNMTQTAPAGATGMVVTYATPTATTTCAAGGLTVTRTSGLASGSTFPVGTTQVCFSATDACGNVGTCCFNVTVNPAASGPCDSQTNQCATVTLNGITTAVNGDKTLCFNVKVDCMNGLSFLAIELPAGCVASSPANGSTYTAPSGRTYTVQNPATNPFYGIKFSPTGGGISQGGMDVFCITLPAGCTPLSTTRVDVKAGNTDYVVNMNTTNCPSTLAINCPADKTATAPTGATGAIVNYTTPTATTSCSMGGLTVTRTSGLASGSIFPVGTTQVCYKATDACGNSKTCCFNVIVTAGSSNVQISCPLNMNVTAPTGTTGMVVTYATPTASTTCASGGLTLTRTSGLASGSTFPVGVTQVCYKATDNCGNSGTCCFNVTVTAGPSGVCDSKTDGCIKVELLSITTAPNGRKTLTFKITSTCAYGLSYAAFELPPNCWAITNGNNYTAPSGRKYTLENGTNNPFFSLKFNSNTEGIKNGESEIFTMTLESGCNPLLNMRVQVKEDGTTHLVTISTANCSGPGLLSSSALTFNASRNAMDVDLKWFSNTGDRNDYFVVEHSTDGTNWTPIKKEEGEGAKGQMLFFAATHDAPPAGQNFYRLVLVYHDGTSFTTASQMVIIPGRGAFGIFPNPTSESASLDLSEFAGKPVEVRVMNQLGIVVQKIEVQSADNVPVTLDTANLPEGSYVVCALTDGRPRTVLLVVAHTN